jgi:hypothetical protein
MDPETLWKQQAPDRLEAMGELYSDLDKDPKRFIRISAPFDLDLYEFGMQNEIRSPPEIVYDREEGHKYQKTENQEAADGYMIADDTEQKPLSFKTESAGTVSRNAALYTKESL